MKTLPHYSPSFRPPLSTQMLSSVLYILYDSTIFYRLIIFSKRYKSKRYEKLDIVRPSQKKTKGSFNISQENIRITQRNLILIQDHQNTEIIKWANNGIGFIVVNEDIFSKDVLPKYFKHSNYSSFVRQVNHLIYSA